MSCMTEHCGNCSATLALFINTNQNTSPVMCVCVCSIRDLKSKMALMPETRSYSTREFLPRGVISSMRGGNARLTYNNPDIADRPTNTLKVAQHIV